MPASVIPFRMPAPAAVPEHVARMLAELPVDQALLQGTDLLLQIGAAETAVCERVDGEGRVGLGAVVGAREAEVRAHLEAGHRYGGPLMGSGSLTEYVARAGSALLIMGTVGVGEAGLPAGLVASLLDGGESADAGFVYVLPLVAEDGRITGSLALLRSRAAGPLSHEQPHLAEALRRLLAQIAAG
ncbi:MAG: hypothetical protein AB1505_25750 [Candidatus Latescibacterota bacterium]